MDNGVWRTVGGRRIFIKDGQDLETAMKESGKFKEKKNKVRINDEQLNKLYEISVEWLEKNKNIIQEKENSLKSAKNAKTIEELENEEPFYKGATKDRNSVYYNKSFEDMKKIIIAEKEKVLERFKNGTVPGSPVALKERIRCIEIFNEVAKKENLTISKSPYSDSFYAHKKNETIDWGVKPEESYRLADHWNWDYGRHCPTNTNSDFGMAVAKQSDGLYYKIS